MTLRIQLTWAVLCCTLLLLLSAPAAAQKATKPAPALTKAEVEQIVKEYLLQHPEVILESVRMFQERQKITQEQKQRNTIVAKQGELLRDADTPSNIDAKPGEVAIVQFFDYRCGFCKRVLATLSKISAANPNVRLVYKEMPILGPESVMASRAALAVAKQGKYLKFHNALMASSAVNMASIEKIAGELGVDVAKMKSDMESAQVNAIIEKNLALGATLEVQATPTFIIGSELYSGAMDEAGFLQMIQRAQPKPAPAP